MYTLIKTVLPSLLVRQLQTDAEQFGVDDGHFAPVHDQRQLRNEHVVEAVGDRLHTGVQFGRRLLVDVDAVDVVRSVDEPQQALRLLHVLVRQQAERDRESPLVVGHVLRRDEVAEVGPETVAVARALDVRDRRHRGGLLRKQQLSRLAPQQHLTDVPVLSSVTFRRARAPGPCNTRT